MGHARTQRWVVRTPDTPERWGSDVAIDKGDWPEMSLAGARKAHAAMLVLLEHGINPVEQRRKARAKPKPKRAALAVAGIPTFGELAEKFVAFQQVQGARPRTVEKYRYLLSLLAPIATRPANSIDVKTLADLYAKIAAKDSRHEATKRAAILVAQVLKHAATTTNIGHEPASAAQFARGSVPKVEVKNLAAIVGLRASANCSARLTVTPGVLSWSAMRCRYSRVPSPGPANCVR